MSVASMARDVWHLVQTQLLRALVGLSIPKGMPAFGNLLVIAPHPDDEVFGAGGVILSALAEQKRVDILYLTDGEGAGVHLDPERIRAERARMTERVRVTLGLPESHLHRFHLPDGGVPRRGKSGFDDVVTRLVARIDQLEPDSVLATHELDFWPYDHVACAELAEAAVTRSRRRPALYLYWVWAWYNLRPDWFLRGRHSGLIAVPIGRWRTAKRCLVERYLVPLAPSGRPWSGQLPAALRQSFNLDFEVVERREVR